MAFHCKITKIISARGTRSESLDSDMNLPSSN